MGNANQTVAYGESGTTVTAIPNYGYKFVKWSDGVNTAERTDKNIISNKEITAEFEKIKITVTYSAGEGGTIDGKAEQEIEYGNDAEFVVAVPDVGYRFVKWSDGSNVPERQDKIITANKNVTAIFEKIKITVSYSAGVGGTIDGKIEQEIEYGNDAEFVVAVPDEGYRFVKWSDGNGSTIRKETCVNTEINVTAEFEFLYEGGEGTASNPFTIANYTQLNDMWYYPESSYKLIKDLDLSGIKHEPIFTATPSYVIPSTVIFPLTLTLWISPTDLPATMPTQYFCFALCVLKSQVFIFALTKFKSPTMPLVTPNSDG